MSTLTVNTKINDIDIKINVKGARWFDVRIKLALLLFRFAGWVGGIKLQLNIINQRTPKSRDIGLYD